jgi:tetratricopeptide (TPR) repeat protein
MRLGHLSWRQCLVIALVGAAFCWFVGCTDDKKYESRIDNKDAGKDPHRFQTAEAMYRVGPTMPPDAKMDDLLRRLARRLETNPDPTSTELCELMVAMEPYRKCETVQAGIQQGVGRCAAWVRARSLAAGVRSERADEHYRKGEFAQAVEEYARVLQQSPHFNDARNNLALAEVHQRHDLAGQFQLEILRQLKPDYLPALINLTVVYERLGQSAKAKALAAETASKCTNVAAATFNLAWYQFGEDETQKAEQTLRPLAELHVDPKHAEFYRLVQKGGATAGTTADQPGFWRRGIAGICGGKTGVGPRIVAIVLFLVSAFFVCAFASSIGKANRFNCGRIAGWSFVFLGSLWFVVFWGIPSGAWWLLMVAYAVIGTVLSAAAAEG